MTTTRRRAVAGSGSGFGLAGPNASRKSSTHSRSRAHAVYAPALFVCDPRATAPAVFFVLRVSAPRRDVVAVGLHDVLLLLLRPRLRQVVVVVVEIVLPPRVHAGAGDALLSAHHRVDGVVGV